MATNCTIVNQTATKFHLKTKPGKGAAWEPDSYEIKATSVDAHGEALFLKLNRDEGIHNGDLYLMDTTVLTEDRQEVMRLREKLVGLTINSDIWARIDSSGKEAASTGWVANGSKTISFSSKGQNYRVTLKWQASSWNDDLEYTIALDD